jgi:hypothetical protein
VPVPIVDPTNTAAILRSCRFVVVNKRTKTGSTGPVPTGDLTVTSSQHQGQRRRGGYPPVGAGRRPEDVGIW